MSNNTQILRQLISNNAGLKNKCLIPVKSHYFDKFVKSVFKHDEFELFVCLGGEFDLYLKHGYCVFDENSDEYSIDWYVMNIKENANLNFNIMLADKSSFKYQDEVFKLFGFYSVEILLHNSLNYKYNRSFGQNFRQNFRQIIKGINICVDTYEPYKLLCAKHLYSSALVESVGYDVLSVIMSLWCESELMCDMVISL